MTVSSAFQAWQKAQAAAKTGDANAARQALKEGLAAFPEDSSFRNSAGSLFQKMGDMEEAETQFGKALALKPEALDIAINHAISLAGLDRHIDALAVLQRYEAEGSRSALYSSTRGMVARGQGNKVEAARWYDRALALEPVRPKALHGRARVALERGETDALAWFDKALSVNQGDADLWLGKAQSLDVAGDVVGARAIAESLFQQAPQWSEGLRFLAQLRLASGDRDFTSHYGDAAERVPQDPNIYAEWCGILAGLDYHQEAANVASRASVLFPKLEHFRLLQATYIGAAGDSEQADKLYSTLELDTPERRLNEARHRIRRAEYLEADKLLDTLLTSDSESVAAWALRGLLWRVTQAPEAGWLHEQAELVQLVPLKRAGEVLENIIPALHRLHDNSPLPLSQSLRGGSQTRGNLFDRHEAVFQQLGDAVCDTVEQFRQSLPGHDSAHPLLRYRDLDWNLAGSWSVRLAGGGDYHISHIHPQGIVSSALYLELPEETENEDKAGWLEIGRPPPDLRLELEPLRIIEPKVGYMALFPSTLYHGTRAFSHQQRMTVAFDVTATQTC